MKIPQKPLITEFIETLRAKGMMVLDVENIDELGAYPNLIKVKGSLDDVSHFIEKNNLNVLTLYCGHLNEVSLDRMNYFLERGDITNSFENFCRANQQHYDSNNIDFDVKHAITSNFNNLGYANFYLFKEGFIFHFYVEDDWYKLVKNFLGQIDKLAAT